MEEKDKYWMDEDRKSPEPEPRRLRRPTALAKSVKKKKTPKSSGLLARLKQQQDKMEQLEESLENRTELYQEQRELLNAGFKALQSQLGTLQSNPGVKQPQKPILVKKDHATTDTQKAEEARFVTPPTSRDPSRVSSRASSVGNSRVSSRADSQEHAREAGMLPVLTNLAYATNQTLKKAEEKYPEARDHLKKYTQGRDAIKNRVLYDEQLLLENVNSMIESREKQMYSNIHQMLKHSMGMSNVQGVNHLVYNAIPEYLANDTLVDNVIKNLFKQFPRVTGESETIRHIIEALITQYDGKLSEKQFRNSVISCCQGKFRDTVSNCFRNQDLNSAIRHIVLSYSNVISKAEKLKLFQNYFLDKSKLRESLRELLKLAEDCYSDFSHEQVVEKAIAQTLRILPIPVRNILTKKLTNMNEVRKLSPFSKPLEWNDFVDLVIQTMNAPFEPKKQEDGKNHVKNVKAGEAAEQQQCMVSEMDVLTDKIGIMGTPSHQV